MKKELRARQMCLLKHIDSHVREDADRRILEYLKRSDALKTSSNIMVYVSLPSEVDTKGLIEYLIASGKNISVPAVQGDRIAAVKIRSLESLETGKFGVLEPPIEQREYIEIGELDLVILPGLCFTEDGKRLGRGGGFYDRFLKLIPDSVHTVGLCYSMQLRGDIPFEEHDMKVNEIVTEDGSAVYTEAGIEKEEK